MEGIYREIFKKCHTRYDTNEMLKCKKCHTRYDTFKVLNKLIC